MIIIVIISTFQNFLCWRRSSEGGVLKVSMDFTIQLSRKGFFLLNLWEGGIFAFVVDLQFNAADRNRSHGVSQAFQLTNDFLVSHLNARTNDTARHTAFLNPETTLFPSAMINNIGVKKRYREPNPFNYFTTIRMLSTWLNTKWRTNCHFLSYLLNGRSPILFFNPLERSHNLFLFL